jgi:hypothetical protein
MKKPMEYPAKNLQIAAQVIHLGVGFVMHSINADPNF